eukprot:3085741-Rhodomonas_salina.1
MQRGCFKQNCKCDLFDCPANLHISKLTFCTEQAPVVRIEEGGWEWGEKRPCNGLETFRQHWTCRLSTADDASAVEVMAWGTMVEVSVPEEQLLSTSKFHARQPGYATVLCGRGLRYHHQVARADAIELDLSSLPWRQPE